MIAETIDDANVGSRGVGGRQPTKEHHSPASDRDRGGVLDRRGERGERLLGETLRRHGSAGGLRCDADRRDTQIVPDRQTGVGMDAPTIDPNLAAAQDPIDVALGHPFEYAKQEIVDPLPLARLVNGKMIHNILA